MKLTNLGNTKVVTIGGGTGHFSILNGLKRIAISRDNVKAIVSTLDNGGSSGKLITQYGVLPPGDIRNCMIALSDESQILADLFNYRFNEEFNNHNFGNLFITILNEITDDFEKAIEITSKILRIRGEIIPVSLDSNNLIAETNLGEKIVGETQIDKSTNKKIKKIYLENNEMSSNPKALDAISNADYVIIGPGDLYTSSIPNLLFNDIKNSLQNTSAKKILVVNVMSKPGETDGYYVENFIEEIQNYMGTSLDYIIVNRNYPDEEILDKYRREENKHPIELKKNSDIDKRIQIYDLINEDNVVRHSPEKLSKAILDIISKDKDSKM
mgnify:FL=1